MDPTDKMEGNKHIKEVLPKPMAKETMVPLPQELSQEIVVLTEMMSPKLGLISGDIKTL